MPKKKKGGNLYKVSNEGRRSRQRKKIQTVEERSKRLEDNAQRHAQKRVNENDDVRSLRLEDDAQRHVHKRRCGNDDARSQRLEDDAQRHAQRRHQCRQLNRHIALIAKGNELNVPIHTLGQMNVECQFCKSLNFKCEESKDGKFTYCCQKGKLELNQINCPDFLKLNQINCPDFLKKLYIGNDSASENFLKNIRSYNSALAMVSMGAPGNRNPLDVVNNAPYCLKIHGQYHHLTSTAMRPADGQAPVFCTALFFREEAINYRMNNKANQECDSEIMKICHALWTNAINLPKLSR
ncbi:uncharacterized protein LOC115240129 [Formica exsecta]|uniref:uncharacterized protein LOC115240129 n=1 Tax=Formica exsecta TaxID=72781 RepID=UPI0011429DAF|nr:uncharacterized protein LOC115240129 [Formica exsecta]